MKADEQFDDLLRDKFNSNDIEFNEKHWQQAEQSIIAKERKERNRKVAAWFFTGAILICGFLFWNVTNTKQSVSTKNKLENENTVTQNKIELREENKPLSTNQKQLLQSKQKELSQNNVEIKMVIEKNKFVTENHQTI